MIRSCHLCNQPPYCHICSHAVLTGTGVLCDNVQLEVRKVNRWEWFLHTKCLSLIKADPAAAVATEQWPKQTNIKTHQQNILKPKTQYINTKSTLPHAGLLWLHAWISMKFLYYLNNLPNCKLRASKHIFPLIREIRINNKIIIWKMEEVTLCNVLFWTSITCFSFMLYIPYGAVSNLSVNWHLINL